MQRSRPFAAPARRSSPAALLFSILLGLGIGFGAAQAESSPDPASQPAAAPADPMAHPMVRQVIQFLRQRDGRKPDSESIVRALNEITLRLLKDGKYSEVEPLARAQLDLAKRKLGREHTGTLMSLNNLAELY